MPPPRKRRHRRRLQLSQPTLRYIWREPWRRYGPARLQCWKRTLGSRVMGQARRQAFCKRSSLLPGLIGKREFSTSDSHEFTAETSLGSDMKERMSLRAKVYQMLAWVDPTCGEHPDWVVWREQAGEVVDSDSSYIGPDNLCRSVRGFVGYKPKNAQRG